VTLPAGAPTTAFPEARPWGAAGKHCIVVTSAFCWLATGAPPCKAAPEEIQVYEDDMSAPGRAGVDVHNNFVASGSDTPGYAGEEPPRHVYRLTPEFYYGLSDTVELGLYVLSSRSPGGESHMDGTKLRLKYIAPHAANEGLFWGANLEVGRTGKRVSETPWNGELKGILGYRTGPWTWAVNPNIDWSLSAHGGPATVDIDVKGAYAITGKSQLGMEVYGELGPVSGLQPLDRNSKTLYAVLDHDFGSFDLNAGVGRGLTTDSDRWTFKFILGAHF
jgi:hypothetical protein